MKKSLQIGDIVGLKSGGSLAMTVTKINGENITAVWANNSAKGIGEKTFPAICLELSTKKEIPVITGIEVK